MKLLSFVTAKVAAFDKSEGRVTEVKGRHHRLSHQNGLMELSFNLSPDERAAFDARSAGLESDLHKVVSSSTDTMNAKIAAAKKEAADAVAAARAKYDLDLFALFTEFGRLPSRSKIIIDETPVGRVVQLPEQAIIQPTAKTARA